MIARTTAKTGINLFILRLTFILINFPTKAVPNIIGVVPNPKRAIKIAPDKAFPVVMAPAKATYTNPHGKKPLRIPKMKSSKGEPDFVSFLKEFFTKLLGN